MAFTDRVLESLVALAGAPLFSPDPLFPRGRRGINPVTASSVAASDAAFAVEAAELGLAEVAYGEVAAERGRTEDVRAFGRRMADEHTSMNTELTRLAVGKRVTIPLSLTTANRAERNRLADLPADRFDEAFASRMVADHEHSVAAFERQRDHGRDVDLTAFAARHLPTLRDHLAAARRISGSTHAKPGKRGRKNTTEKH